MSFRRELKAAARRARGDRWGSSILPASPGPGPFGFRGPLGGGMFGSGRAPQSGSAPAIFVSGQSNAGIQDVTTTGWAPDPRCSLTWYDGTTLTGPSELLPQTGNGHSVELTLGTTLASIYNTGIQVGKTWGDGTLSMDWVRAAPGRLMWSRTMTTVATYFANLKAAGITQLAYFWLQGESESTTVQSAQTPFWQANFTSHAQTIRALAAAFGIARVRFYVLQTNINDQFQGGYTLALLNSVRAQQAAFVAADPDARLLNADATVPSSTVHYTNGQTLTLGTTWANLVALDFTAAQPAPVAAPTMSTIWGASLLLSSDSRVTTGTPIGTWPSEDPAHHDWTAAGAARPTLTPNVIGTVPGVTFDGAANFMSTSLVLPAPGTTPTFISAVSESLQWRNGDQWWGVAGAGGLLDFGGTPQTEPYNGTFGHNIPFPQNTVLRWEEYLSNSNVVYATTPPGVVTTGDYNKIYESMGSGINFGNNAIGSPLLCKGNGAGFGNKVHLKFVITNALPSQLQADQMCAYYLANYGLSVGLT